MLTSRIRQWLINNSLGNEETVETIQSLSSKQIWQIGIPTFLIILVLQVIRIFWMFSTFIMTATLAGIIVVLSTSNKVLPVSTQTLFWAITILYALAALKTYNRRKESKINRLLYYLVLPALFITNLVIL